jgi:hypothetical protein
MVSLLIWFVIVVILLSLPVHGPALPEPVQKFAYIVLALIGVICVVWLLWAW